MCYSNLSKIFSLKLSIILFFSAYEYTFTDEVIGIDIVVDLDYD